MMLHLPPIHANVTQYYQQREPSQTQHSNPIYRKEKAVKSLNNIYYCSCKNLNVHSHCR